MHKQLLLNDLLKKELQRYTSLLSKMERDLAFLPKGSLSVKGDRHYIVAKHDDRFLHLRINEYDADGRLLINELKYKRYIKAARPILKKKIRAIKALQDSYPLYDPLDIRAKLGRQYHDIKDLPIFLQGDFDADAWDPETAPAMYEAGLRHPSKYGLMTRSKAEAMIATALKDSGMKFQYEAATRLWHRTVRPDFKILLPHARKFVYWEHLGKLDDPNYVMDNLTKLQDYADAGILLGRNLVITFETKDKPLTYDTIHRTIDRIRRM